LHTSTIANIKYYIIIIILIQFDLFEIDLITNILLYKHNKFRSIIIQRHRVGIKVFISLTEINLAGDMELGTLPSVVYYYIYRIYVY